MRPAARLSKRELVDLIETTEAEGGDATALRGLLAEVEGEERRWQPARPQVPLGTRREELSTEDFIKAKADDLFPNGAPPNLLSMVIEYDGKYNLKELKRMCKEAGLSPNGEKKLLAAKLIARQGGS